MSATTSPSVHRCPKCLAIADPGAAWCSLCYAAIGPSPAAEAPAPPAPDEPVTVKAPRPLLTPRQRTEEPPAGARREGPHDSAGEDLDPADAALSPDILVTLLAAEEAERSTARMGVLAPLLRTKGQRAALAFVGTVLFCGVLLLAMVVLGSLLG